MLFCQWCHHFQSSTRHNANRQCMGKDLSAADGVSFQTYRFIFKRQGKNGKWSWGVVVKFPVYLWSHGILMQLLVPSPSREQARLMLKWLWNNTHFLSVSEHFSLSALKQFSFSFNLWNTFFFFNLWSSADFPLISEAVVFTVVSETVQFFL